MSECTPGCQHQDHGPDRYLDAGVVRDRLLAVPAVKWDLMNRKERRRMAREGYHRGA